MSAEWLLLLGAVGSTVVVAVLAWWFSWERWE